MSSFPLCLVAENKKHVSTFTSSGALVVNDTVLHVGGVCHSGTGTGCYHGKHSSLFDAFSHMIVQKLRLVWRQRVLSSLQQRPTILPILRETLWSCISFC